MKRCDRKCIYCVNFIFKLMLTGYDGVCDKDGKMVRLTDACDDFLPGRNKIYQKDGEKVTSMNDLRKCPFCGCDARVEMTGTTIENGEEYDDYTVVCTNKECLCFLGVGLFRSKEAAIEAWNRRANDEVEKKRNKVVLEL